MAKIKLTLGLGWQAMFKQTESFQNDWIRRGEEKLQGLLSTLFRKIRGVTLIVILAENRIKTYIHENISIFTRIPYLLRPICSFHFDGSSGINLPSLLKRSRGKQAWDIEYNICIISPAICGRNRHEWHFGYRVPCRFRDLGLSFIKSLTVG